MYITNLEELVPLLRSKLADYLTLKLGTTVVESEHKYFRCFAHEDDTPSMHLNARTGYETAHCFGCGIEANIFNACAHIDGLPDSGPGWLSETVPHLCELLKIPFTTGEPTKLEMEKMKYFALAQEIADVLATSELNSDYIEKRGWVGSDIVIGSVATDKLMQHLLGKGWIAQTLASMGMIKTSRFSYLDADKVTFVITDHRNRPCAFISRSLSSDAKQKYLNTPESPIFSKRNVLMGLGSALKQAKREALVIVEGPGDLAHLRRLGVQNSVAVCGTALTADHLNLLKVLGIKKLLLCLDWDGAGQNATERFLKKELSQVTGITCQILSAPESGEKDMDALLFGQEDLSRFDSLKRMGAFEWMLSVTPEHHDVALVCQEMVPLIATEPAAVRRELLIQQLATYTGISAGSIDADVQALRNHKMEERTERLITSAERYFREVASNPLDIQAAMAFHEEEVELVEKEFNREYIGVNYQLSRYDALQEQRDINNNDEVHTEFIMHQYRDFARAMSGGMSWTDGPLIYVGGRANCFAADTVFLDPFSGIPTTADKLTHVHSTNVETRETSIMEVSDYIDSGVQECFRVTNSIGFSVETTREHRYLTPSGWKRLYELSVGSKIAAPVGFKMRNEMSQVDNSIQKAEFLGLMLGDGNMTQARPLFTNCDPEINKHIDKLVKEIFGNKIQTSVYMTEESKGTPNYRMVGFTQSDWKTHRNSKGYCYPNPVTTWFKKLGLYEKRAWEKSIPDEYLYTSPKIQAALLRGLFSTDGTVTKSSVEFTTTSKELADGMRLILSCLGIGFSYRVRTAGKEHWRVGYELKIKAKSELLKFKETVGFLGEKGKRLHALDLNLKKSPGAKHYENEIQWVRIASIQSVGLKPTCDITVPGNESFNVPGFVLHNSGKTATCHALGLDIALSDEDAITVLQTIDDSYAQIEPRLKTNISYLLNPNLSPGERLQIGMAANPYKNILTEAQWKLYHEATDVLRGLLADEKLIVLDAEDGPTLSVLDKNLRHLRKRYPSKKVVTVADNTHNYMDFLTLEQRIRMTRIANTQKAYAAKYHMCMIATVEYRKNMPQDTSRMRLPIDDDIADARALTYRPNMIIHVYNDLHDRKDDAEIFWQHPYHGQKPLPRLMLVITKNKLTSFKDKLILDLDPSSVTLSQYSTDRAREESEDFADAKDDGRVKIDSSGMILLRSDYEPGDA